MEMLLKTSLELIKLVKMPIFIIVLSYVSLLFYVKNKEILELNKHGMNGTKNLALKLTVKEISIGLIAGFAISLLLNFMGIEFLKNSGIEIMFILSLVFMKLKPRMICFSYSATAIIFISIIFDFLYKTAGINNYFNFKFKDIIILVGVMHVIEGILVAIDGHKGAVPIFKTVDGKVYGGLKLSRRWLTPITSFVGIIGYSASTYTLDKKAKARESGFIISTYGCFLLLITYISGDNDLLIILSAIIMPIAHEFMLKMQRYFEKNRENKFVSIDGICILDINENGKASNIGLESGDIIISANNFKIFSETELFDIIKRYQGIVELEFKKNDGKIYKNTLKLNNAENFLITFVPRKEDFESSIDLKDRSFKNFLDSACKENS